MMRRVLLAFSMSVALLMRVGVTGAEAASEPKLRVVGANFVASWGATTPSPKECWKKGGDGAADTYTLRRASTVCTAPLKMVPVAVTIDANNVLTFGGVPQTPPIVSLDSAGRRIVIADLRSAKKAATLTHNGLLLADAKGVYLPSSLESAVAPAPAAARAAEGHATLTNPRVADNKFLADWDATPPSASTCWTIVGAAGTAGKGTYSLNNASKTCTATLGLTAVPVTIDSNAILSFDGAPRTGKVSALDSAGKLVDIDSLKAVETQSVASEKGILFADGKDGNGSHWHLPSTIKPVSTTGTPAAQVAPCTNWPQDTADHNNALVAIDLPLGSVVKAPPRNVVLPNQALTVVVCHERGQQVTVQWGGTRGLTSVGTNDATHAAPLTQSESIVEAPPVKTTPVDYSVTRFSPRQPGTADINLTIGSDKAPSVPAIELEVDTLYWGSVRFGLGTLIDVGNNWKSYSVTTMPGSRQPEIAEQRDPVAFELVSGFAPYLFDLGCPGHGRSYTGGCNSYVAPYLGFGVLGGSTNQGLQALTSAHLGLELEFSKSFSVAATLVLRRTKCLNSGYQPGSPVTIGMTVADVTSNTWSTGLAIVVNATPDFLQFATGGGIGSTGTTQLPPSTAQTSSGKQ